MKNLKQCSICKQVFDEDNEVVQLNANELATLQREQFGIDICIECQSLIQKQKLVDFINLLPNNFIEFERIDFCFDKISITTRLNDNQTLTTKYKWV